MAPRAVAYNHPHYAEIRVTGTTESRIAFARFARLVEEFDLCGRNINSPIGNYWTLLCKLPLGHAGECGYMDHYYAALGLSNEFGISLQPKPKVG